MNKKDRYFRLIDRMHQKLNELITEHGYDLQSKQVLSYSQRLDRVLKKLYLTENNE